mgnify:FL=1
MDKVLAAFLTGVLMLLAFGAKQLWTLSNDVSTLKAEVRILMRERSRR